MFIRIKLIGTTAADGSATVTATRSVNGLLYGLHEDKGTLADGVDFTLAVVLSEAVQTVITLTNANTDNQMFFPRLDSCSVTGTALSQNMTMIPIMGTLRLTIAQGGDTKTGGMYAYVLE